MWTKVSLEPAELTLHSTGGLTWNTALQLEMNSPRWIDIMWDAATNRLGIRPMTKEVGFPVIEDEGEYKALSAGALNLADISVDENVSSQTMCDMGIRCISLPS